MISSADLPYSLVTELQTTNYKYRAPECKSFTSWCMRSVQIPSTAQQSAVLTLPIKRNIKGIPVNHASYNLRIVYLKKLLKANNNNERQDQHQGNQEKSVSIQFYSKSSFIQTYITRSEFIELRIHRAITVTHIEQQHQCGSFLVATCIQNIRYVTVTLQKDSTAGNHETREEGLKGRSYHHRVDQVAIVLSENKPLSNDGSSPLFNNELFIIHEKLSYKSEQCFSDKCRAAPV